MTSTTAPTLDLGELPAADPLDVELSLGADATAAPGASAPALTPEKQAELEALGIAALIVTAGTSLAARRWPRLIWEESEKTELARLGAPVLAKHNVRSALLDKYKEEAALAMFLLGLFEKKRGELARSAPPGESTELHAEPRVIEGESMSAFEAVQRGIKF